MLTLQAIVCVRALIAHSGLLDDHKLYVRMQFKTGTCMGQSCYSFILYTLDIHHFSFSVASAIRRPFNSQKEPHLFVSFSFSFIVRFVNVTEKKNENSI